MTTSKMEKTKPQNFKVYPTLIPNSSTSLNEFSFCQPKPYNNLCSTELTQGENTD